MRPSISAPAGVYMFWSPQPGVIVYQYRKGKLVPVPVGEPEPAGERRWKFELRPMTPEQKAAVATVTVGRMLLLIAMLLLRARRSMTRQMPALQYGDWETVKKRMARVVTQLKRGADLVKVMTADGMFDTEATPGLLSMFGIITGARANFHCFMPWRTLCDAVIDEDEPSVPPPIENAIFAASLRTSWGVLGLLAHDSQSWLIPASRHRQFLDAALDVWPELDAVGGVRRWRPAPAPVAGAEQTCTLCSRTWACPRHSWMRRYRRRDFAHCSSTCGR